MIESTSNNQYLQQVQSVDSKPHLIKRVWSEIKTWPSRLVIAIQAVVMKIWGFFRRQKPQDSNSPPTSSVNPHATQLSQTSDPNSNPKTELPKSEQVQPTLGENRDTLTPQAVPTTPKIEQPAQSTTQSMTVEPGIIPVPQNGNCVIASIFEGLKRLYPEKVDNKGYTIENLRKKSADFLAGVINGEKVENSEEFLFAIDQEMRDYNNDLLKPCTSLQKTIEDLNAKVDSYARQVIEGTKTIESFEIEGKVLSDHIEAAQQALSKAISLYEERKIKTRDQYVSRSMEDGFWCGAPQILFLSGGLPGFGVPIHVYRKGVPEVRDADKFNPTKVTTPPIKIQYNEGARHYDLKID